MKFTIEKNIILEGLNNVIKAISTKNVIPIHYNAIVGTKEDANRFIDLLDDEIDGEILMK